MSCQAGRRGGVNGAKVLDAVLGLAGQDFAPTGHEALIPRRLGRVEFGPLRIVDSRVVFGFFVDGLIGRFYRGGHPIDESFLGRDTPGHHLRKRHHGYVDLVQPFHRICLQTDGIVDRFAVQTVCRISHRLAHVIGQLREQRHSLRHRFIRWRRAGWSAGGRWSAGRLGRLQGVGNLLL